MPYIPPEVVEKAREMDLMTYLKSYDLQEFVHFGGNTYCTREHDRLKISNGKWCWFSCGIGGYSALDYLTKVKEMPFMQAVETIMGNVAVSPPTYIPAWARGISSDFIGDANGSDKHYSLGFQRKRKAAR